MCFEGTRPAAAAAGSPPPPSRAKPRHPDQPGVLWELWRDVRDHMLSYLFANRRFPDRPTERFVVGPEQCVVCNDTEDQGRASDRTPDCRLGDAAACADAWSRRFGDNDKLDPNPWPNGCPSWPSWPSECGNYGTEQCWAYWAIHYCHHMCLAARDEDIECRGAASFDCGVESTARFLRGYLLDCCANCVRASKGP